MPNIATAPQQQRAIPSYEVVGPPGAPAIVALGGISADRHVCRSTVHLAGTAAGWWEPIAGPGRALDTTRYQLAGMDFLDGGCCADGRPARAVTTHDQADAVAAVLDEIGVERLHAFVGASYGGMVALAFAERHPHRVERLVVISAAERPHPMATALRAVQRRIVELGLGTGRPREALALARALAMTTYRSAAEFADRFSAAAAQRTDDGAAFPVEQYLLARGNEFAARHAPSRFLALSLSIDLHTVDPAAITTPALLVAAENDAVVPRAQMQQLARALAGPSRLVDLPSTRGHDAFLTEPDTLGPILHGALTDPIS